MMHKWFHSWPVLSHFHSCDMARDAAPAPACRFEIRSRFTISSKMVKKSVYVLSNFRILPSVPSSAGPNWATKMAPEMPQPKSSDPGQAEYHSDHEQGPRGLRMASFQRQHLLGVTLRGFDRKHVSPLVTVLHPKAINEQRRRNVSLMWDGLKSKICANR